MKKNDVSICQDDIVAIHKDARHFGTIKDATSRASIKGPCGEEMEFNLVIRNETIEEVKYYTKGCIYTRACGEMTAKLAQGKSIDNALSISPKQVMRMLKGLPEEHSHCSILAVTTLYRAIANYLLK